MEGFVEDTLQFQIKNSVQYTPNANMADLSVGPGLAARKRG